MIRYRVDTKRATVAAVECEPSGYPHPDADGEQQFDNTHFDDEGDAWDKLVDELAAGISLSADRRADAKQEVKRATRRLADYSERWVRAVAARSAWQRKREKAYGS